jgi:putative hydrolase of HD superfamily
MLFEDSRLRRQMEFIVEIDKMKSIYRRSYLIDRSRHENDAEHSWHIATMALFLSEYANERDIDLMRVVKMLLIHDLVEIDAGDTFAYDAEGHKTKAEREEQAARRLFVLLPKEQGEESYRLWREFEEEATPEAKFAVAMDRLHPMLLNYFTQGAGWKENGVSSEQVLAYNRKIAEGSERLWQFAQNLIRDAVAKGYLRP